MVELKHWVARDATEHGQIVTDSDLSSDGIFLRLETDLQFRSIATAIVQQYGYLVPKKLNPDSDSGKEHDLLLQERVRRLAQNQEQEELARAFISGGIQSPRNDAQCDPQLDRGCNASQTSASASRSPRQGSPGGAAQLSGLSSPEPNFPSLPSADPNPILRAQITKRQEIPQAGSPNFHRRVRMNPLSPSMTSGIPPENLGFRNRGSEPPVWTGLGGRKSNAGSAGDGLLAAYGMETNPAEWQFAEYQRNGRHGRFSIHTSGSPIGAAVHPRSSEVPFREPPEMIRKSTPYESIPSLYDMNVQAVPRPAAPAVWRGRLSNGREMRSRFQWICPPGRNM